MAYDLYIHLKTNTAKNVCSEIRDILSAQKPENSFGQMREAAACEVPEYSNEVQAKFDEIGQIAKIIADQKPKSFKPDSYYMNVMHVQFYSEGAINKVNREFEKISLLVATRPEKFVAPGSSSFESMDAEIHKKTSFEEPKEPCLGKRVCIRDCQSCVVA